MENCVIVHNSKDESTRIQKILFSKGIKWDNGAEFKYFKNPFIIINNRLYQTGINLKDTKFQYSSPKYRYFYNFTGNDFLKNFN